MDRDRGRSGSQEARQGLPVLDSRKRKRGSRRRRTGPDKSALGARSPGGEGRKYYIMLEEKVGRRASDPQRTESSTSCFKKMIH